MLASARDDASGYADVIRCAVWSIHDGNTGNSRSPATRIQWQLVRAEEKLTKVNAVLILCAHSVISADRKTELFVCGCKPEYIENYECRMCKCRKLSKGCVFTECRC